jgi:hypothetical protein
MDELFLYLIFSHLSVVTIIFIILCFLIFSSNIRLNDFLESIRNKNKNAERQWSEHYYSRADSIIDYSLIDRSINNATPATVFDPSQVLKAVKTKPLKPYKPTHLLKKANQGKLAPQQQVATNKSILL